MEILRHLLQRRRLAVLCALTLLAKLLVPAGWMVNPAQGWPAIMLCPQAAPLPNGVLEQHAAMAHDHDRSGGKGRSDMPAKDSPCIFAGMPAATLPAVDPILLATLIAFVVALVVAGQAVVPPRRFDKWRPRLRAPPLLR